MCPQTTTEGLVTAPGAQQAGHELGERGFGVNCSFLPFVSTLTPLLGSSFLVWHQTHLGHDASLTPHF